MAVAGSLTYSTEIDTKGIKSGLSEVESDVKKTGSVLDVALGNIVANLASVAVDGLKQITAAGVDYNAQMESYETAFEVMLGNQQEAVALMEKLKEVGASTPFELSDLAGASQQLLAYGTSSEELIPIMTQLGDISLGNKEKFDSLVLAYGKMNSTGKVTLEYLNLMTERGFNPLNYIAEETGATMEEMYDKVSAGEITFEDVQKAIDSATSEGGQFFQGMEKQSKTFSGQMSTLSDNVSMFLGEAFEPLFTFLSETALPVLNDFLSGGEMLSEWFEENETAVTLFAIAVGTLTFAMIAYQLSIHGATIATGILTTVTSVFAGIMAFITSPITLVILAIGALIAIIYLLVKNFDVIGETAVKVWDWIVGIWEGVADWFKEKVVDPVVGFFTGMWDSIKSVFSSSWEWLKSIFSSTGSAFKGIAEGIASIFITAVNWIISGINKVIAAPLNTLNWVLNKVRNVDILGVTPFDGFWKQNPIPVPQIPQLARGGVVSKATYAMIGEDGQEAVVPLENNTEWVGKVANLMQNAILSDKTYNPSANILSSSNNANNGVYEIIADTPVQLYLDNEVVYAGQQKIAFRKKLGGTL